MFKYGCVEGAPALCIRVLFIRRGNLGGQYSVWIKTWVDLSNANVTNRQQCRAHEQHLSQRNLGNDKDIARAATLPPFAGLSGAFFERRIQICPRGLKGRQQSKADPAE